MSTNILNNLYVFGKMKVQASWHLTLYHAFIGWYKIQLKLKSWQLSRYKWELLLKISFFIRWIELLETNLVIQIPLFDQKVELFHYYPKMIIESPGISMCDITTNKKLYRVTATANGFWSVVFYLQRFCFAMFQKNPK